MKVSDVFWAKFHPKNAENHRWEISRMSGITISDQTLIFKYKVLVVGAALNGTITHSGTVTLPNS